MGAAASRCRQTVSRALSRPELVTDATRERVERAVRETGYVPNLAASHLASNRSRTVAAILPAISTSVFSDTLRAATARLAEVLGMLSVLGLDATDPIWQRGGDDARLVGVVDGLVSTLLEQRAAARERRDFAVADALRDALSDLGIAITDTPAGPRWSLAAH